MEKNNGIKKAVVLALCLLMCSGCRQSQRVSYNVSKEADNFSVVRRITVINARTDNVIYEMEGVFSISNSSPQELSVICKTGENEYKKHYISLTGNTLYVVEDIGGADVSPYHYEVTFFPQMIGVDLQWGDK